MSLIKTLVFILIFTIVSSVGSFTIAQEATSTSQENNSLTEVVSSTTENVVVKEKKKKKDKDENKKDKNEVRIGESFYYNLLIDLLTVIIIVIFIHYRNYRKKNTLFTYFLFNISIFLLTFLLNEVKMSMGAAFGLFAVFSMLRYRTEGISTKDMTYLFIVIAIGLISAIRLEYYELGIINGILIVATFLLDGNVLIKREFSKRVKYEKIEMIKPENHQALIEDLIERTGLNIHRIAIKGVDYLRDVANIDIFFYENPKIVKKK
jgi:hypothetical protein